MSLDAHAHFAQFLDPAPHLLPRHADFLCDLGAADDDRRILGEQSQQRVQTPVGRPRQISHSFRNHVNQKAYATAAARTRRATKPSGAGGRRMSWSAGACPRLLQGEACLAALRCIQAEDWHDGSNPPNSGKNATHSDIIWFVVTVKASGISSLSHGNPNTVLRNPGVASFSNQPAEHHG